MDVHDVVEVVAEEFLPACDAQAFALLVPEAGRAQVIRARGFTTQWLHR